MQRAIEVYRLGNNITQALNADGYENTPDVIALAHDLQAGKMPSYPENLINDRAVEVSTILQDLIDDESTLLDVGTGEMLMLQLVVDQLRSQPREVFACDLSWSRIFKAPMKATAFVADHIAIPLPTKSIDVIMSDNVMMYEHQDRVFQVLQELFRVSKSYCVFIEPSYDLSSDKGKHRIREFKYLYEGWLMSNINLLGGSIIHECVIKNNYKSEMPNKVWVVKVPQTNDISNWPEFTIPGTDYGLDSELFSNDLLVSFPTIKGIPILLNTHAVVTSALIHDKYL